MSRLFSAEADGPDARPALFAVVSLMLLLLPALLMTTAGDGLTGLGLAVPPGGAAPPLPHAGPLRALSVEVGPGGWALRAEVRSTDAHSLGAPSALREERGDGLGALQGALRRLKALDPAQTRLSLRPDPDRPAQAVVALIDAVSADLEGELFPEVVLEAQASAAPAAPVGEAAP
jgi:hypothetical protein